MTNVIEAHLPEIQALCRRYGVARLEIFGSATSDAFDPERSDIDFLVDFDANSSNLFARYFSLKEALESLYGRSVDLVTIGSLRNPYFIESINKTRHPVYVAEGTETA
jgi:predicted nucleotidyltransferase